MPIKVVGYDGTVALAEAIKKANATADESSSAVAGLGEEFAELTGLVTGAITDLETEEMTAETVQSLWNA